MGLCPGCSAETPAESRFCPSCGAALGGAAAADLTSAATRTSAQHGRLSAEAGGLLASHDSFDQVRFLPGQILDGRWRVVGLLGRGGMGEVYRADDLKLGEVVALKFLPEALTHDTHRRQRFLNEVKLARQVAHANVCRVYDVGEADGHPFLSMEFVDGEDLASLLRRIGRLPGDKAVQIARQICAGLAAAHEQGILHRDLKPANVMIDGRGRVRITDFGLAGLAGEVEGAEVLSGTPAYMAPEQLAGRGVSVRSDVYALGLVLYELFTGKPAYRAESAAEMARLKEESAPSSLASHVDNIDPAIERIVLRCLETDPSGRPASALAVAAALPGGDPLAAALAAGETPSPELVADAGGAGSLTLRIAALLLTVVLVCLVARPFVGERISVLHHASLPLPPEALSVKASEVVRLAGVTEAPADTAFGFSTDGDLLRHLRAQDGDDARAFVGTVRPSPVFFWYRQSPRSLAHPEFWSRFRATHETPPPLVSSMAEVRLDPEGRLTRLEIVPPQRVDEDDPGASSANVEPDWSFLFERAGIDPAALAPASPQWISLADTDLRRAWVGSFPGQPDVPLRVEAGAFRGKPVSFRLVLPWTMPERMDEAPWSAGEIVGTIVGLFTIATALIGGVILARRNLRLGRGDRQGAFRVFVVAFAAIAAGALLQADHSAALEEVSILFETLAWSTLLSGTLWLVYLALEPYVRKLWPAILVSWKRLLQGRLRDPLVGRDVLIGAATGVIVVTSRSLVDLLAGLDVDLLTTEQDFVEIMGVRETLSNISLVTFAMTDTLFYTFLLLLLRIVLRRPWAAVAVLTLVLASVQTTASSDPLVAGPVMLAYWAILLTLIVRVGLLAFLAARVFMMPFWNFDYTTDLSSWYFSLSMLPSLALLVIAGYAFWTSLGGRVLLSDSLLEDASPRATPS